MLRHFRQPFFTFFFLLLPVTLIWANSGKISGRVTNAETGEPLPGVNIIVEEISLGAASDLDGNYVILNIPPGNYTVVASAIGFSRYRITDLRVNTGQTTRQNFKLTPEVLEGEEVTVVAERPMVRADLTSSQKITTADEMKELPVETFLGVLTTQAGVNTGADGALHIRGGRTNEVGYYIDGVSVANPFFTNSLGVSVSNKALEEMKVVSGGFNAEYGNAMSGIVNIQIREGGPAYHGSFTAYTGDYISNDTDIFMNIDDIDPLTNTILEGTLNGPMPLLGGGGKFTFNISGRYQNDEGYYYGKREHAPDDFADFRNPDFWYIEMGGDGKYVPMARDERLNTLTKLTYRINPKLKISVQLINDMRKDKDYSHAWKYNPDGLYTNYRNNSNYSVKLNQMFSKSFYTINIFKNLTSFERYLYKDPEDDRYVSTNTILGAPPATTFYFGGTYMNHLYRYSTTLGGKFDYTWQVNPRHEVQLGIESRLDNLEQDEFTILYDNQDYREPTVLPANESPSHTYFNNDVVFTSAYVQDKIEYSDMIVNIGTRYDYFDPQEKYITNLINPEAGRAVASPKATVSPRLGVSFPITDEGILHFSYGHFYQLPTLRRLYESIYFGANLSPEVGYSNLKPEKTVLYEFGLQQQFNRFLALDGSLFYKDIRDLLALQSISYSSPQYGPSSYAVYLNKDYGNVKGITLSLTKRYDPQTKTSMFLDYSYQVTEGNSVASGAFYFNALTGEEEEKRIVPLAWDQSQILNATVTISEPNNWALSFVGKMSTGWPYTPIIPDANYDPDPNSARKPNQRRLDMRLSKYFDIGPVNLVLLLKVYNVLDTRNERYVYDDTGRAGYTYYNRTNQETEAFTSHYGEEGVHTWEEYNVRPQYYTAPRSVQAGLSIEF